MINTESLNQWRLLDMAYEDEGYEDDQDDDDDDDDSDW